MARSEIEASIQIAAEPARVFDVVADPGRLADWLPGVESVAPEGSGRAKGSRRVVELVMGGMRIRSRQEITRHEAPHHFAWIHVENLVDGKPFDMLEDIGTSISIVPVPSGCRVDVKAHVTPKGIKARLALPLVSREIQKQMNVALENLRDIVQTAPDAKKASKKRAK